MPLHLTLRRQLAKFRGLPIHCTGHKPLLLATVSGAVVLDGRTRAHALWSVRRGCLAAVKQRSLHTGVFVLPLEEL